MNLVPLIGRNLKSDAIIEFLEAWNVDVVYDFDRLHENVPDAAQTLTTLFLRVCAEEQCAAFDLLQSDIPSFATIEDAIQFSRKADLSMSQGSAAFLGSNGNWIKLAFAAHTVHYEFTEGVLNLVTVAIRSDAKATLGLAVDR